MNAADKATPRKAGRPYDDTAGPVVRLNITMSPTTLQELDELRAATPGATRSGIITRAVREYIAAQAEQPTRVQ